MAKKRYKAEELIQHLRTAEIEQQKGATQDQAARKIGVTVTTLVRWKKEYGGLEIDQAIGLGKFPVRLFCRPKFGSLTFPKDVFIVGITLACRNGDVGGVGNLKEDLPQVFVCLIQGLLHFLSLLFDLCNLQLGCFSFFPFALLHQGPNGLGSFVQLSQQGIRFHLSLALLFIQFQGLTDEYGKRGVAPFFEPTEDFIGILAEYVGLEHGF
jgi:DNA-binding XRE family transcriptional regulator